MHPFRFGVVTERAQSGHEWREKARKAEDLGFSTLLVPDHTDKDIAPIAAMMAALAATNTLRIGSFVLNTDLRNPVLMAKEAATLDLFSEGRFEFGLGPGYMPTDYASAGIPFEGAATRIARFEEAVSLTKLLFTEEEVHFQGTHYVVHQTTGLPRSKQKPHPPLYIGGGGQRMLSLAAREADIVGFAPRNSPKGLHFSDPLETKVEWVRSAAKERFSRLELSAIVFRLVVTHTPDPVIARIAQHLHVLAEDVVHSPHILVGSIDAIVAKLQEQRRKTGISYIEILEEYIDDFGPIVKQLAGS